MCYICFQVKFNKSYSINDVDDIVIAVDDDDDVVVVIVVVVVSVVMSSVFKFDFLFVVIVAF